MTTAAGTDPLADVRTLLFVIGAQKAGTTWFHQQFARHPEMHFARKEFHYWNARRSPYVNFRAVPVQPVLGLLEKLRGRAGDLLIRASARLGDGVLAWRMILAAPENHVAYRQALVRRMSTGVQVVGDITPSYALLSPRVFAEMAAMHPDTRFVFILRDPVGRLWSGIRHRLRRYHGRAGVDPALASRWFAAALDDPMDVDLRGSQYDHTIRALDKAVPADRVLYLFYETLFTPAAIASLHDFLGVAPHTVSSEAKAFVTTDWPVKPAPDVFARAMDVLSPSYAFVRQRFGAAVPETWRRPDQTASLPIKETAL